MAMTSLALALIFAAAGGVAVPAKPRPAPSPPPAAACTVVGTGSTNVLAEGKPASRLGDGACAPAVQGSTNVMINGRPALWGDALLGLVEASGLLDDRQQSIDGEGDNRTATFETKRKGRASFVKFTFSVADAKKAKLWGKAGPWTDYPDRMLLNRARAFNLRDQFPDVLKGLAVAEEAQDIDEHRVIRVENAANRTQALSAAMPPPPVAIDAEADEVIDAA
jgi:hypothetical protein